MKALLKFFGFSVSDKGQVTDISLAFHGINPSWAFLIALIIVGTTAWVYFTSSKHLSKARRVTLIILRSVLLLMILFMLMRPVLLLTVEGTIRRSLLLLIDISSSMQIKDLRQDPDDLKRAAIARGLLDPSGGLKQGAPSDPSLSQMSRSDVVKAMLTNDKLKLLEKLSQTYDVIPYAFGQNLQALSGGGDKNASADVSKAGADADKTAPGTKPDEASTVKTGSFLDSLVFDKPYTAIGDGVRSLLDLKRGQPLAGVFLITDGGNNYGSQPMDAAALAQQDKVPLYIYGVGITSPHDIIVSSLFCPDVIFAREDTTVSVNVRSQSMSGRQAKLVLKLGGEVMDTKDITFGADGEQTVNMKLNPPKKGDYELEASIDPLADEAIKDNNKASQRVRVIDGKIQVLYVETKPRWEYRYLQAMMIRDRRLDPKFLLLEGDPSLSKDEGSPFLANFPATRDEIMKYDVIIIGDVDPTRTFNNLQMQSMADLVSSFGGGLIFIAGKKFMPDAYRGTPLAPLFPVEFEGQLGLGNAALNPKPIVLDLTPAGQSSPTMRIVDKEDENVAVWKKLPGIYWDTRVSRAKPAAEVLLTDPSPEKATRGGAMPVIVLQSYGTGQTLFMGTDETWRWRKNVGEKYFTRLWGQVLIRFGMPRLLGASRLTQLATDRKNYVAGERVTISGQLYRNGFQPVTDSSVRGTVTIKPDDGVNAAPTDLKRSVTLDATPGRPGFYQGEFIVTTPGVYSFSTEMDPSSALDFRVTQPRFEYGETALNLTLLRDMAKTSGGAVYREEDLYHMLEPEGAPKGGSDDTSKNQQVPDGLGGATEKVPSPQEVELTFSSFYFALMILIATVEWTLRKLWRLK